MNLRELAKERPAYAPTEPYIAPRNTARESWDRFWPDVVRRLIPFGVASVVYARRSKGGLKGVGLTDAHLARDLLLGGAVGVPMAGVAAAFRSWAVPGYRLPTRADQAVQSFYYIALNAPVEELFWRGMLQSLAVKWARRRLASDRRGAVAGWALATAGFGVFHSLGGDWNWQSVVGATAAGGVFGLVYLLQPEPRSIWPSVVVHGLTTSGFFSWGDLVLHWRAKRRAHRGA